MYIICLYTMHKLHTLYRLFTLHILQRKIEYSRSDCNCKCICKYIRLEPRSDELFILFIYIFSNPSCLVNTYTYTIYIHQVQSLYDLCIIYVKLMHSFSVPYTFCCIIGIDIILPEYNFQMQTIRWKISIYIYLHNVKIYIYVAWA